MPFVTFCPLDLHSERELHFLFDTRSHPEICKYLLGKPPVSFEAHCEWVKNNVPSKRLMFLLKSKDVPVAYCHAYDFLDKPTVEVGFAVHPSYQGFGYGREMVKRLIEYLTIHMSDKRIILYVQNDNYRAVKLYRDHGFVPRNLIQNTTCYEYHNAHNDT